MNCDEVRNRLSEYLDGELTPLERSELASHIERCPACASELDTIKRTVELVRSLPRLCAPPKLAPELKRRVSASTTVFTKRLFALAGAAAVILVAFLLVLNFIGESETPISEVKEFAAEKEAAPADYAAKSLAWESEMEKAQKPYPAESRGQAAVAQQRTELGEMALTRAESSKNLAESGGTSSPAGPALEEQKQSQEKLEKFADSSDGAKRAKAFSKFAEQESETVGKLAQVAAAPDEVAESEITIPTSDLKGALDKIESFLAQISPEGGLKEWEIARQVSENGAITLVIDCPSETRYQQLVDRVSRLKASLDSGARAASGAIAGAKVTEDLAKKDKESESRETAKAMKKEKAKSGGLQPEGAQPPRAPAAEAADEEKRVEQPAVEPSKDAQKAELPEITEKKLDAKPFAGQPQTALSKTKEQEPPAGGGGKQAEAQEKQVRKRYVVKVKLVVPDRK